MVSFTISVSELWAHIKIKLCVSQLNSVGWFSYQSPSVSCTLAAGAERRRRRNRVSWWHYSGGGHELEGSRRGLFNQEVHAAAMCQELLLWSARSSVLHQQVIYSLASSSVVNFWIRELMASFKNSDFFTAAMWLSGLDVCPFVIRLIWVIEMSET